MKKKRIRCLEEVSNYYIVGFKDNHTKSKGYIIFVGSLGRADDVFCAISSQSEGWDYSVPNVSFGSQVKKNNLAYNRHMSVRSTIKYLQKQFDIKKFYKFESQKDLHKWLAK